MPASIAASAAPSLCGTRSSASITGSEKSARSMAASSASMPSPVCAETITSTWSAMTRLVARCQAFALMRVEQVDLVQHFNARLAERLQFAEHLFHLRLLLLAVGRGGVAHVQQHLGLLHFFKRGAKAGDQRVRQVADESDRVRQQNVAAAGQLDRAQLGIERGKHARRLQHLRAGEPIEQRALARVGVAHQRDRGHGNGLRGAGAAAGARGAPLRDRA